MNGPLGCANAFDQLVVVASYGRCDMSNCSPSVLYVQYALMIQILLSGAMFKRRSRAELANLSIARDVGMSVPKYQLYREVESGS